MNWRPESTYIVPSLPLYRYLLLLNSRWKGSGFYFWWLPQLPRFWGPHNFGPGKEGPNKGLVALGTTWGHSKGHPDKGQAGLHHSRPQDPTTESHTWLEVCKPITLSGFFYNQSDLNILKHSLKDLDKQKVRLVRLSLKGLLPLILICF